MRLIETPRNEVPVVTVFWCATGVGKSRRARQVIAGDDLYIWHPQQSTWFDSYDRHLSVLFEEFRGQLSFDFLLSLTDRYDCRIQFKGGLCQFVAMKIYFTSTLPPRDWYPELGARDSSNQLERRLTHVIDLNGIAEEERAKRVCLMLESGEVFVDVEEDQKATKIVDLPLVQSPPWRSAYNSTSEFGQPRCLLRSSSFSVDSASHTRWFRAVCCSW